MDAATGKASDFRADASAAVYALARAGRTLYLGGRFTEIGSRPRSHLAAIDLARGKVTKFDPRPNRDVLALAVSGDVVYAGGRFTSIGGRARMRIAAIDRTSAKATGFDRGAEGQVGALAVSKHRIFAGSGLGGRRFLPYSDWPSRFDPSLGSIGGVRRSNIAAIDARTGEAIGFAPRTDKPVSTLAVSAGTVYAGGLFSRFESD